jgi:ABC-type transport system substrate-binding protein
MSSITQHYDRRPLNNKTWTYPSGYDPHGGFVDRLTLVHYDYRVTDEALLALQLGLVSSFDGQIPHNAIVDLDARPGIEVASEAGTSFRHFTMQCQRFPTNLTGYRRALAFALDKFRVVENARGGLAQVMDNPIPPIYSFWSFENEIRFHFYAEDINSANTTLDAAHIIDTPDSPHPGWRYYDADNSGSWTENVDVRGDVLSPYGMKIEVMASVNSESAIEASRVMVEGMQQCGLQGDAVVVDFNALLAMVTDQGEWNMACFEWNIEPPGTPDILYDFFHVKGFDNSFFFRFNNSEYNYNSSQLMNAPTRLEARDWSWNCCRLLIEEMPIIVCYNTQNTRAYRTDLWEGYVNQIGLNRIGDNPFTFEQIHLNWEAGGPFGCYPTEYITIITEDLDGTNPIYYPISRLHILFNIIYSRLWRIDPLDQQFNHAPDLAWNWTLEPTIASGDIQEGMKYTFRLFENVTWHDGTPFTAEDVQYSIMSIYRMMWFGRADIASVYRVDTPDNFTVEIYSNSTAYMTWTKVSNPLILPKHIWSVYAPNFTWAPQTPFDLSGTGCYKWAGMLPDQRILLDRFDAWHFGITQPPRTACPSLQPSPQRTV